MKRVFLVELKACPRCRRAVAYLKTESGEDTLGIVLDACKAKELSCRYQEPSQEQFLTDLLLRLSASSSCTLLRAVLDCNEEGILSARVDITKEDRTEGFVCSPQEALGVAVAAGIPLYAEERIFHQRHLFHPPDMEGESIDLIRPKLKPTLH